MLEDSSTFSDAVINTAKIYLLRYMIITKYNFKRQSLIKISRFGIDSLYFQLQDLS